MPNNAWVLPMRAKVRDRAISQAELGDVQVNSRQHVTHNLASSGYLATYPMHFEPVFLPAEFSSVSRMPMRAVLVRKLRGLAVPRLLSVSSHNPQPLYDLARQVHGNV